MWLIRGLISLAVDAIESKNISKPATTARASLRQSRSAQLRIAELEHAIWAPSRARLSRQSTARCRQRRRDQYNKSEQPEHRRPAPLSHQLARLTFMMGRHNAPSPCQHSKSSSAKQTCVWSVCQACDETKVFGQAACRRWPVLRKEICRTLDLSKTGAGSAFSPLRRQTTPPAPTSYTDTTPALHDRRPSALRQTTRRPHPPPRPPPTCPP